MSIQAKLTTASVGCQASEALHEKAFQAVKTAAETLQAVLDDAQKAKAKDVLPGLAEHRPGTMRHAGMGAHGMPHGTGTH